MTTAIQSLAQLLIANHIVLNAQCASKSELFALIDRTLNGQADIMMKAWPQQIWQQSLQAREQLASTAIGQGVAIPHARIRGLDRLIALYIRLESPISFDAPDGKPVTHVISIFVPEQATQAHLQLLAGVAELFGDARFREAIEQCADANSVVDLINVWAAQT